MTEPRTGPKFGQPTFKCNYCYNFTHRTSRSCLNHSQEPCELVGADLGALRVESEQKWHWLLKFLPFDIWPFTLPIFSEKEQNLKVGSFNLTW